MKETDLVGYENCEIPLTGFSHRTQGRGRPREIEDDALRRAVMELQFVLEQNWGVVGWELYQAKTLGDIRSAFLKITGFKCPRLEVFRREPTKRATAAELRKIRKNLDDALDQNRKTYATAKQKDESAERALHTMDYATVRNSREAVQSLRTALAIEQKEASAALDASRSSIRDLQSKLEKQEAWFAQSQIGKFIESRRREFTPLNVAMAMAGLPQLTARVSCERCSALNPQIENGHTFRMFNAVRAVIKRQPRDMNEEVEHMRSYLLQPCRKLLPHIAELRKNWHFLESAIRSVHQLSGTEEDAVIFRIFAEYQRRFECQSRADVLLAQRSQL